MVMNMNEFERLLKDKIKLLEFLSNLKTNNIKVAYNVVSDLGDYGYEDNEFIASYKIFLINLNTKLVIIFKLNENVLYFNDSFIITITDNDINYNYDLFDKTLNNKNIKQITL